MESVKKSLNSNSIGIIKTGIFALIINLFLFLLSYSFLGKIQIENFSLSGTLSVIISVCVISFLWILFNVHFNFKKTESVKNVFCAYLSGFLIHFALRQFFERLLIDSVFISSTFRFLYFVKDGFLISLSFYFSLYLFVGKFQDFNSEEKAPFYGSLVGIGIAGAVCILDLIKFPSLNFQFLVIVILSKTMIVSSICALSSYLFVTFQKKWQLIISFFLIVLVYSSSISLRIIFKRNLQLSQYNIQEFLIPLFYMLILFGILIFFIERKNFKFEDFVFPEKKSGIFSILFFIILISISTVLGLDSMKSIKITSPDSTVTVKIPYGFERYKKISFESIFSKEIITKETYIKKFTYLKEPLNMEIDFKPKFLDSFEYQESPLSPVKNCKIYDVPMRPLRSGENTPDKKKLIYLLKKGELSISLEFSGSIRNRRYIDGIIKMIAKSM